MKHVSMTTQSKQLQDKLWAAAEHMRANSSLKLSEISEPILGLIFLKFADVRFKKAEEKLENEPNKIQSSRHRPIMSDDYKARGVLYVPEKARFSYLISLPENVDLGKTINEAKKAIKELNNTNLDERNIIVKEATPRE